MAGSLATKSCQVIEDLAGRGERGGGAGWFPQNQGNIKTTDRQNMRGLTLWGGGGGSIGCPSTENIKNLKDFICFSLL
jgi:hypothetical protein